MPSPKLGIIILSLCVSIMVYLVRARKYLLIIIGRFAFFLLLCMLITDFYNYK